MNTKQAKNILLSNNDFKKAYNSTDLAFEISKMVIDARIARDLTQEELAEKLGTKQPSIARIESGRSLPSLLMLQRIADALETELLPPRYSILSPSVELKTVSDTKESWLDVILNTWRPTELQAISTDQWRTI